MSLVPEQNPTLLSHPSGHRGTLRTAGGDELPVQTYEHEQEVLLVVLTEVEQPPVGEENDATLEYTTVRGVIRLHGEAVFQDASLVRFRAEGAPEVVQRRQFVRVHASHEVTVDAPPLYAPRRTHTVDISGGGMLLSDAGHLRIGDVVRFEIRFADSTPPAEGIARVVRIDAGGRRGLRFETIDEDDRQRLIRYVFELMRVARAKTRGDLI
ncbi:MAG TPA: PilZ domain-containing protein [Solirubrobacteraceae bacterium]|nr:PilZ domain-containing protein [Solirubrobacteraceae bacterium]